MYIYIYILLNLYLILKEYKVIFKTYIISEFSYVLVDNIIKFDSNKYLIGFEFKVYDIQHYKLRDYKPENYISMNTGYGIDIEN